MEELSAFAPPVEEQPFDRFYKKPVATAKPATEAVAATRSMAAEPLAAPAPVISVATPPIEPIPAETAPTPQAPLYTGEPSAVPGKRIIYVTMPAGRNTAPPVRETREMPAKEPARPVTSDPSHAAYASGPGYSKHCKGPFGESRYV